MKRVLLTAAVVLMFLSTLAVPNAAYADGPNAGCQAGCKP
jgi:hypothetical protein